MTRPPNQYESQSTLRSSACVDGVALFTGTPSRCVIHPAPINHGVTFAYNGTTIPVSPHNISNAPVHPAFQDIPPRCSALSTGSTTVWLVEHVLSALAGIGITNALIEVDHCELPIMDGSSLSFVQAIQEAGIETQNTPVNPIVINQVIRVEQGDSWIEVSPTECCSYQYTIDYGADSPIVRATVDWDSDADIYTDRVAPARTFCLEHEADMLVKAGLFTHLNPGDMLVLGDSGPIDCTLRDEHECAYHKLLDLIGDVALIGRPIQGQIRAHKSGHALAHEFARAVLDAQ